MGASHVFGWILIIIGAFLIGFAMRASQSLKDKMVSGITGRYSRRTMWYIVGGVLLILIGGALAFLGGA